MTDEERLYKAVQKTIDDHRDQGEISPSWVATEVMCAIRFPRTLHNLGYVGCHLEIRQIARQKLRSKYDPEERIKQSVQGEDDLFADTLQDRYPRLRKPGDEPIYAIRELLSDADVFHNTSRMRLGGAALLKHADALEAWHAERRKTG